MPLGMVLKNIHCPKPDAKPCRAIERTKELTPIFVEVSPPDRASPERPRCRASRQAEKNLAIRLLYGFDSRT
jgi:hypothetical protein